MKTITVRTDPVLGAMIGFLVGTIPRGLMWAYCVLAFGVMLKAQTPIPQGNPQFKSGIPIKVGSFTLRIIESGEPVTSENLAAVDAPSGACITADSNGKPRYTVCPQEHAMLAIGSTDKSITSAIVEIFYQARFKEINSAGPLLLHKELTCPIIVHIREAAPNLCNQDLGVRPEAIMIIRIKGSAEVETQEVGKP